MVAHALERGHAGQEGGDETPKLGNPVIHATPAAISATAAPAATITRTLTVSNSGDVPLNYVFPDGAYQFIDSDTAGGPAFTWTDISATGTKITVKVRSWK